MGIKLYKVAVKSAKELKADIDVLEKGRKASGVGAISKNGKYRKEAMSVGDTKGKWVLIKN